MDALRMSTVLRSTRWAADVAALAHLFGAPDLVDPDVWARFDVGGAALCVAGGSETPGDALMVKVADLDVACVDAATGGWQVGAAETGRHERRAVARSPGGITVVLYETLPA